MGVRIELINNCKVCDRWQDGYNPTIMSAYDFYRGIEYELNKLLDWLGYEE